MSVVTLEGHAFPSVLNIRVDGILRRYVPERTCRNASYDPLGFRCSECGAEDYMDGGAIVWVDGGPQDVSYCPHCGARVMPNDRP